ncbi:unnamed protein product [Xylocopa violacea]|uniref:DNA primase large subunit C-terminal domain-containing protein n=1 Tax=Xylocopa violacea TaxID=135666 RepID=A0ABP1NLK3_XYLVO
MFYIKTPTGQISLHVLEKCTLARLEYLQLLYDGKTHEFNGNFEYLLENSIYDQIGHFTLRLLASVSQDLHNHWIVRETLFFQTRLDYISPRHLYRLFRSILRQLRLKEGKKLIDETLINISSFCLQTIVFKHLVSKTHTEECKLFKTKVRFELVPNLIKERELDLYAGYAIVYCSKWKKVLVSLFCTYITKEIICMKTKAQNIVSQDSRLDYLYHKINSMIFRANHARGHLTTETIDTEVNNFPLCMRHLHTVLRSTHRLSHYARLYYSLFLKDGGMQLEDAINYWKEEYSKPHACSSICSHNWQSNEQKFIYSIRHLYGLEGSRRNYKSPTCESMCTSIPSSMYEGGCPFKNFDINILKNLLRVSLSDNEITKILKMISPQYPQIACAEFFRLVNQNKKNNIVIYSPLQYYLTMINQM